MPTRNTVDVADNEASYEHQEFEEQLIIPSDGNQKWLGVPIGLIAIGAIAYFLISSSSDGEASRTIAFGAGGFFGFLGLIALKKYCEGWITIEPNQALVCTFLGKYVGTVKENGVFWVNPFYKKE